MNEHELMLTELLECERIDLALQRKPLTAEQKAQYTQMQQRRAQGEPLQYILQKADFMGNKLFVDPRVLIPRPETEILVELTLERIVRRWTKREFCVLELGTGSGNIPVAIAKHCRYAQITSVDISRDALEVAQKNAVNNGVRERVQLIRSDMLAWLRSCIRQNRSYDLIIANPPYVPTVQLAHLPDDVKREPQLALDGGADGLRYYRAIIDCAYRILNRDGFVALECGDGQREAIAGIFSRYPQYDPAEYYQDYVGTDRIVMAGLKGIRQG